MPPAPVSRSHRTRLTPARGASHPASAPPAPADHVEERRPREDRQRRGAGTPDQNPENLVREQERGGRRAMGGTAPGGSAAAPIATGRVQSGRLTTEPGKCRRIKALRRSFQHRHSNMRAGGLRKRRKSAIPARPAGDPRAELTRRPDRPHPPPKLSPPTPSKQALIGAVEAGTSISAPYFIGFQTLRRCETAPVPPCRASGTENGTGKPKNIKGIFFRFHWFHWFHGYRSHVRARVCDRVTRAREGVEPVEPAR